MKKRYFLTILIALAVVIVYFILNTKETNMEKKDLSGLSQAVFAGGCFWCVEADFEKLDGVEEAVSGYSGGDEKNPSYEDVSSGATGHREAVMVYYDENKVSYRQLVKYFFMSTNPTDRGGQFVDRGKQYTSAIFYIDDEQKKVAEEEKQLLIDSQVFEEKIVTEILPFKKFYLAEKYHQDYFRKNSFSYNNYRRGSGRDEFIEEKKSYFDESNFNEGLNNTSFESQKEKLTPMQYKVTQEEGTEDAFQNEYWDNKEPGIYVDVVSGEPLFSSLDKFESGTGWPSFTKPISPEAVIEKEDSKLFLKRTEIRSAEADSHLGHVFNDGPEPTGERYCMNSAALRFIPKNDLKKEGFGEFLSLFE